MASPVSWAGPYCFGCVFTLQLPVSVSISTRGPGGRAVLRACPARTQLQPRLDRARPRPGARADAAIEGNSSVGFLSILSTFRIQAGVAGMIGFAVLV